MSSQWIRHGIRLVAVLALFVLMVASTVAQDSTNRVLTPGQTVTGTLDEANPVQIYTYSGVAGQEVSFTVSSEDEIGVYLVLSDATGAALQPEEIEDAGDEADAILTRAFSLPADGTYYVTIVASESFEGAEVTFDLATEVLTNTVVTFTEPGELLTATGLQISLTWNATANLDLEVRDPVGGSLRFATPTVASGGQFGVNVNSVCNTLTADAPSEQASWPAGVVPTGSYELLVYYQPLTDCPTSDPVTFTINAVVDGVVVPPFEGTLTPNEVFIASFRVNADGSVDSGLSGVREDPPSAEGIVTTNTLPLVLNTPVDGIIASGQPYQVYSFTAQANDVVSIAMTANSGSLDTALLVLDPNGNLVAANDDAQLGVTDSLVPNLSLVLPGSYTVIATRYGREIGGTEGEYTLSLTGAVNPSDPLASVLPPDLPNLPNGSVEVSLQWATGADLQLLVRDPQGAAVYDDTPQIPSGGTLAAQGNVNCVPAVGTPVSYIYWPEGRLPPAGPYEIEVQYQNQCNDTRPVTFTLNVVAGEQVVLAQSQQILPGERYVTSYTINVDGTVTAGEGGIIGTVQRPDVSSLDFAPQIETAQILTSGQTVNGSIRINDKFDVYVFDGQAGQVVTIGMQARNGTLDPVLYLLDQGSVQIAENDDAGTDTRDALISEFTLPEDGRYIIIATHFGAAHGVTSGDYTLTLRLN
jgi:hypothetical protein